MNNYLQAICEALSLQNSELLEIISGSKVVNKPVFLRFVNIGMFKNADIDELENSNLPIIEVAEVIVDDNISTQEAVVDAQLSCATPEVSVFTEIAQPVDKNVAIEAEVVEAKVLEAVQDIVSEDKKETLYVESKAEEVTRPTKEVIYGTGKLPEKEEYIPNACHRRYKGLIIGKPYKPKQKKGR